MNIPHTSAFQQAGARRQPAVMASGRRQLLRVSPSQSFSGKFLVFLVGCGDSGKAPCLTAASVLSSTNHKDDQAVSHLIQCVSQMHTHHFLQAPVQRGCSAPEISEALTFLPLPLLSSAALVSPPVSWSIWQSNKTISLRIKVPTAGTHPGCFLFIADHTLGVRTHLSTFDSRFSSH